MSEMYNDRKGDGGEGSDRAELVIWDFFLRPNPAAISNNLSTSFLQSGGVPVDSYRDWMKMNSVSIPASDECVLMLYMYAYDVLWDVGFTYYSDVVVVSSPYGSLEIRGNSSNDFIDTLRELELLSNPFDESFCKYFKKYNDQSWYEKMRQKILCIENYDIDNDLSRRITGRVCNYHCVLLHIHRLIVKYGYAFSISV